MDAAEKTKAGLFDQILPPRLEDAGLEDCALPPDSIREAFFKAASAVKSTLLSSDDTDARCVDDPWPTAADRPTDVVSAIEKGARLPKFGRDEVVVGGGEIDGEGRGNEVVVGGTEETAGKACVDGLQGLEIGEESKKKNKKKGDEEAEAEKTILGEGFV